MESRKVCESKLGGRKKSVLELIKDSIESLHESRKGKSRSPSRLRKSPSALNMILSNGLQFSQSKSSLTQGKSLCSKSRPLSFVDSNRHSRFESPSKKSIEAKERIQKLKEAVNGKHLVKKIEFHQYSSRKTLGSSYEPLVTETKFEYTEGSVEKIHRKHDFPREPEGKSKLSQSLAEKSLPKSADLPFKQEKSLNTESYSENHVKSKPEHFLTMTNYISQLNESNASLRRKISALEDSVAKVSSAQIEEHNSVLSIVNKLEKLENLSVPEPQDNKIPIMIEKIVKLECNYDKIKASNDSTLKNFQKEMNEVNYKLQDMKECNEILKELVICLQKDPINDRDTQDAETYVEKRRYEPEETISLDRLDPTNLHRDLLQQKELLMKEKEKMELEYKSIPSNSKSMSNKRRRQALELELSMNYSKLMSVNNKIKKY